MTNPTAALNADERLVHPEFTGTAAEFAAFIKEEVPKWAQAVKVSGAKVD